MTNDIDVATIGQIVQRNAREHGGRTAVAFPGQRLTHEEFAGAVRRAARFLRASGVGPGDHVGIFLPAASAEYLVLGVATMHLGAVAVCLNSRFKTRELTFTLGHARCRVVLGAAPLLDLLRECAGPTDQIVDVDDVRRQWWEERAPGIEQAPDVDLDAPARIIYTSGTTSMPKACVHTHRALAHQGTSVARRLGLSVEDRFWAPLTMFHTGGWTPFLAAQAVGAGYHHPGHFTAEVAVRQIADDRCTVLFPGFETIWMQVLSHPEFSADRFDAARLVINVGVPERLRIMQELLPGAPQISNTGCTEVGGFLCLGEAGDSDDSRFHTAGRLLDGMEARIVDPTGGDVPDGTPGELVVRGPACLLEYYDDPEGTAAALQDGWFRTGDLLKRLPGGEFVFISRLKDMLKVGGENVAAVEIEDHLLTHPAIRMVAVVSAPDSYYGEVPAAFVELSPGETASEAEVIEFCRGAIASFKVPRHVRFLQDWPMSGTKIRKVDLRRQIAGDLDPGR